MIVGLDSSSSRPTSAIAVQAQAAGVGLWSGYIATQSGVNLASPWDQASFDIARQVGGMPIAFCSGWDDPVALRQLAAAWNVRLCVDIESGIRGDGSWVQGFLDLSGAGLYGQHYQDTNGTWHSIHLNRTAAFHVMSWYIGHDPSATWIGPQPVDGSPLAWQWEGDHSEFGLEVDRGWYDDWFAGAFSGAGAGGDMTPEEHAALMRIRDTTEQLWSDLSGTIDPSGRTVGQVLLDILAAVKAGGALSPQQVQLLQDTHDALLRVEAALKSA